MAGTLPLPKYHRIYLVLREQLQEGRFEQGLPGELALMQQFGVARVTVRRALEQPLGLDDADVAHKLFGRENKLGVDEPAKQRR